MCAMPRFLHSLFRSMPSQIPVLIGGNFIYLSFPIVVLRLNYPQETYHDIYRDGG